MFGDMRVLSLDWRKLFTVKKQHVLGLDIGSSAVRIVQLEKNDDGYVVTAVGTADIAPTKDANDKSSEEINTTKAISKCLETIGVQTKWVACGVCGPETAVRTFEFPKLLPEEIPGAVRLEAEQVCPFFNISDSVVDYQLLPVAKESICGVLVAATDKVIKWKRRLAIGASLENVLMDIDGLAILNCFSEFEKPQPGQTVAILNVGNSYTNLAIMNQNTLPFVRDIAYAGADIIKQIALENNMPEEIVKSVLAGQENANQSHYKLDNCLEKACQKLFVDVSETLRYYTAQEKSAIVKKLFVCGGFALVKGFIELLSEHLTMEVVLWNPFEKIKTNVALPCKTMLEKNGPAMAVAAGLAMRSI